MRQVEQLRDFARVGHQLRLCDRGRHDARETRADDLAAEVRGFRIGGQFAHETVVEAQLLER